MTDPADLRRLRVLVPTHRELYDLVSYGMVVDFEDAVAELSDADLLPVPLPSRRATLEALRRGHRLKPLTPPRDRYDVCLLVAMDVAFLPSLGAIAGLREVADRVVVYLFDSWVRDLPALRRHRRAAALVDDLFVSFEHAVEPYARALPARVHHLPQAVDRRRFAPATSGHRIDILSVGRRLPSAHRELLELARSEDLFYYFQTAKAPRAIDLGENQELLASLCRLGRLHVSWRVELTDPPRAEGASPVTARWFEAAASGATVIGSRPRTPEFERLFPYDGFVREIDPDRPGDAARVARAALADAGDHDDGLRRLAGHVREHHSWHARWADIVAACAG